MIKSYKYLNTAVQLQLHEFILAFFNRIENESGDFTDDFFGADFLDIANRHPHILKKACIDIYDVVKLLDQPARTALCTQIRESNNIINICQGNYQPPTIDRHATGLNAQLRDLFLNLYNQVLDGNGFNEKYNTTLRTHFDDFSKLNSEITLCPICGIGELKKHTDLARDQYDHYLPKSLYPLSAVNFKNLIPICTDCNSLQVKGSKDVVTLATNHQLFYLFDENHRGITVTFTIIADSIKTEDIHWNIIFLNPDGKINEIESWKTIYNIEGRYKGFVNARTEKWYRHYWDYFKAGTISHLPDEVKQLCYDVFLQADEEHYLNFIRKPALTGFLTGSTLAQAAIQAAYYSTPPSA